MAPLLPERTWVQSGPANLPTSTTSGMPCVLHTKPDFIVATAPGGPKKAVAYVDTGLSASYPELKWMTIVEQDYREANAVVDSLIRKLLWAALGVLICITGLALYLSTHRRLQFTDIGDIEEAKARAAKRQGA